MTLSGVDTELASNMQAFVVSLICLPSSTTILEEAETVSFVVGIFVSGEQRNGPAQH